jgi:imipenem/basic amino acid-specific outer membrane pore
MKIVKMSLAAAMLMGASAFAVENVQISGDANVFYSTSDAKGQLSNLAVGETDGTLFDKHSSAADASLNLNLTADLYKNDLVSISAAAGYTAISTLGLENNFVSNVWGGSHTAVAGTGATYADALGGAKVENASWFTEAYAVVAAGNTAAKIGRMALDTPLAFTETWSIEKNTFEGAAVINQDIPGTTVVLAWVGNGNGTETFGEDRRSAVADSGQLGFPGTSLAVGPVVNGEGKFATYGTDGAYAAGIVNNSLEMLTFQAWYYDVMRLAQAYWIQADFSMMGILAGVQYSAVEVDADNSDEDNIVAAMLGYEMKDVVTVKAAFSQTNDKGSLGWAGRNTATGTSASKIYTETWWSYGYITQTDTTSFSISAEGSVPNIVDLGLYYTMADQASKKDGTGTELQNNDMSEITLTASKSFGPLDLTLAYINTDLEQAEDPINTVQGYITLNF